MGPALRSWPVTAPDIPSQDELRTLRIDLSSRAVGLAPPPCSIQAWFMRHGEGHRLLVLCPPGHAPRVSRWLAQHGIPDATVEQGLAPRSLWAHLDRLPPGWQPFLLDRGVQRFEMTPEGTASLFVEDTEARSESLMARVREAAPEAHAREALTGEPGDLLTGRQKEVLAVAVASGYYDVPRRITLRGLASAMGLSPGATSELLRRGERTIVSSFFDSGSASAWAWDREE